jgi:hypothetical protein
MINKKRRVRNMTQPVIVFRDLYQRIEVNHEKSQSEQPVLGQDLNPVEESDALSLCKLVR